MIPQQIIKLYLSGKYKIEEHGQVVATGRVVQDTGLRQLDAFLAGFKEALSSDAEGSKMFGQMLSQAATELKARADATGDLLAIRIESSLDPRAKTLAYTFTIEREGKPGG